MGIRFYCPNGHKLNVKSFLAGKRGICPHCGIKFEIPQQSVAIGKIPTAVPEAPQAENVGNPFESLEIPGVTQVAAPAVGSIPQSAGGEGSRSAAGQIATATQAVGTAGALPAGRNYAQPFSNASFGAAPLTTTPTAPRPFVPSGPPNAPGDPISEAPAAVWYVRPVSGGQFGPAPGEVLRQWLEQKRVGPDSMLWRDGWPDWRLASNVFPHLVAAAQRLNPGPVAATAPIPSRPTIAPQGADDWTEAIIDTKPLHHRHRASSQQSNIILGISLAIILLGAVLAFVLIRMAMRQRNDTETFDAHQFLPRVTARSVA